MPHIVTVILPDSIDQIMRDTLEPREHLCEITDDDRAQFLRGQIYAYLHMIHVHEFAEEFKLLNESYDES